MDLNKWFVERSSINFFFMVTSYLQVKVETDQVNTMIMAKVNYVRTVSDGEENNLIIIIKKYIAGKWRLNSIEINKKTEKWWKKSECGLEEIRQGEKVVEYLDRDKKKWREMVLSLWLEEWLMLATIKINRFLQRINQYKQNCMFHTKQ